MSYVWAAIIGGVALTLLSSDSDKTTTFLTGALVGFGVQTVLRATKVS
jgi:hypothetical protein